LNPVARFYRFRLVNFIARLRRNKGEAVYLVSLSLVAAFIAYGWILGRVAAAAATFQNHLAAVKLALPMLLSLGAMSGGFARSPAKWMVPWTSEALAALPVLPRAIYRWALAATSAVDSLWILLGLVLTTDAAIVLHLRWWSEFGGCMIAVIILVAVTSLSKVLLMLVVRCGRWVSPGVRDWSAGTAVIGILQAAYVACGLILHLFGKGFSFIAEGLIFAVGLLFLIILERLGNLIVLRQWPAILASFEQSARVNLSAASLPRVSRVVESFSSRVSRVFALCAIMEKSALGIQRFYLLAGNLAASAVALLLVCVLTLLFHWPALVLGISGGILAFAVSSKAYSDLAPVYNLFRPLPVRFRRTAVGAGVMPLSVSLPLIGMSLVLGLPLGLAGAGIALGSALIAWLALASSRHFILLAYPESRRRADNTFALCFGIAVWVAFQSLYLAPVFPLAFSRFFAHKAKFQWERGEAVSFGPGGKVFTHEQ